MAHSSLTGTPALLERCATWPRRALMRFAAMFPPSAIVQRVVTAATIDVQPDEAWRRIVFYEDVPQPAPLLLRLLLPVPLRTSKPGLAAGAIVQCSYSEGGRLAKRITEVLAPTLVRFEVIEQQLGVEACLTTVAGSYQIEAGPEGSLIALTTTYRGHLRPRWLWRWPEQWLGHALHRHILRGMGAKFG